MDPANGIQTLSRRAVENLEGPDHWAPLVGALSNQWSPSNPNGLAMLDLAENTLMHNELEEHIKHNFEIAQLAHFSYGQGPQGSIRLRKALASYFNEYFLPLQSVSSHEFMVTSGVTSLIDHITWCICNEGDGILFPQPLYPGFTNDLPARSRGRIIPVSFAREDGTLDLNDVFDAVSNTRCLERAYHQASNSGIKIRGLMITNPHNPLGKCYPVETIEAIAAFCAKYGLHYLSDEIYAMSVFENKTFPKAVSFTSVLSVDLGRIIDSTLVHVLYGVAKDFCANGLRLGTLHTRNDALRKASTGIATFGWEAYIVQDMWARILEDRSFLDNFFRQNQTRLAERHAQVTEFLRRNGIAYFEGGNAGLFLWIDLRNRFHDTEGTEASKVETTSDRSKEKETELRNLWRKKGVTVTKGSSCLTEELGWFRLVFTVEKNCLRVGLQRLVEVLKDF